MYRRNLDNQVLLLIQPPSFFPKEPMPSLSMWIELVPEQRLLSSYFIPNFDSVGFRGFETLSTTQNFVFDIN